MDQANLQEIKILHRQLHIINLLMQLREVWEFQFQMDKINSFQILKQ
jgi:hypothetical protein